MFRLHPPFLNIPEENNFSDMWENICLKLLKLEKGTNNILRRSPPESGVDLYYEEEKIAYQCKCVIQDSGKFNIKKAKDSLEAALKIKDELLWEKYVICTNINLTGSQINQLKNIYSGVEIRDKDYWIGLCEKYYSLIKHHFNTVLRIPETSIVNHFNTQINLPKHKKNYLQSLLLKGNNINVLFYTKKHDTLYELTVSLHYTVRDLIILLRARMNLTKHYSEQIVDDSEITEVLKIDNVDYFLGSGSEDQTLKQLNIQNGAIICYEILVYLNEFGITIPYLLLNNKYCRKENFETNIVQKVFSEFDRSISGGRDD
ncbi:MULTISPECIES: hypothetical protein [unclassified Paenibacillus]|uniref:hypothetical protein n=1 Tax=unclassified Paenibacillus TaxID=185978 RepID=UPI0013EBC50E|nr:MULTISPECIES: hypothetical protein [unclassified Paenibacillus]KAF6563651.1 hypothetical protein G9G63_13035 [Paenibacillus sp. EKM202P]KAF6568672.1 hypothetical protein G9G64_14615 [Paenibacillus sp. EKM207P]